jgi:hypothetical protein
MPSVSRNCEHSIKAAWRGDAPPMPLSATLERCVGQLGSMKTAGWISKGAVSQLKLFPLVFSRLTFYIDEAAVIENL